MSFNPKDGMSNFDRVSTVRGYYVGPWGEEVQVFNSLGNFVGPGAGVSSLNGLTGLVTISAGSNITITPSGNDLEISATGGGGGSGITDLTGDVTATGPGSAAATISANVIYNSMVNSTAGIVYSKLNLSGSIVNADLAATAAISFSKLAALASGNILVGNGSNVAASVAMSGDVTISNAGVTAIGANKVTNAQLAQMAAHTFKGNNTGSTADADDLTATELTAELNNFVGDSGAGGTKGLVPAPASGDASKFLRGDATWVSISGGGGDVVGPASATDNAIARFDLTTGKLLQNSVVTINDLGAYNSTSTISVSGSITGASFIPSGSSVPSNGIYLPSSNTLGFATNSLDRGSISSAGLWTIGSTAIPVSHVINGGLQIAGTTIENYIQLITGSSTTANASAWGSLIFPSFSSTQIYAMIGQQVLINTGANASTWNTSFLCNYMSSTPVKGTNHTFTNFINYLCTGTDTWNATYNAALADTSNFTNNAFISQLVTSHPSFFSGAQDWAQLSTPSNPASGRNRLYFKSDGNLYKLDNSGIETAIGGGGSGDVTGPGSSTDNAIVRFDSTTGKIIQNSVVTISDLGAYSSTSTIAVTGSVSGGSLIPTASSIPANGMYLPSANTLGFASNSIARGSISSSGAWTVGSSSSTVTHVVNGGLQANRHIGILGAPATNETVAIVGTTLASGASVWGFSSRFTTTTTQTSAAYAYYAQPVIPNSSFTCGLVANYQADGMSKGASATVTRFIGFYQSQQTSAATNNAGIADNSSFTGNWFINSTNTNPTGLSGAIDMAQIATPSTPAASRNRIYPKSDGVFYKLDPSGTEVNVATGLRSIGITLDGGGSVITTGVKGYIEVPYRGTITGWTILGDTTGSIVVDVWKDTYANYPPTVADTIAGSEKPTITSSTKGQDLSLSTWTTSVSVGDIIAFNVDSCSNITKATLVIRILPT